jgi:hypothetical protein
MLVAPVYSWDDGTYTIGVYKSVDAAVNAAKEHTELDDLQYVQSSSDDVAFLVEPDDDPQDAKVWGEYTSEYKIITRELSDDVYTNWLV